MKNKLECKAYKYMLNTKRSFVVKIYGKILEYLSSSALVSRE